MTWGVPGVDWAGEIEAAFLGLFVYKSQILSWNGSQPPKIPFSIPRIQIGIFLAVPFPIFPIRVIESFLFWFFIIDIVPLGQAWIDAGNNVDFRSTLTWIIFGIVAALMAF